ncbi:MAG: glutamate-1-semialdehyde 2,1-aminomutase [Lentisphaeria bacterium]|nr:glutamate-1-semialdehyde 2,1-aminomutase [Lentisphaeria bacterium]
MSKSSELFARAQKVIPGGVNSPVRAFKAVGRTPIFMDHGKGARLYSTDGEEFLEYCGSWGPLIFGHCRPEIFNAVNQAAQKGMSFGTCCEAEVKLAELMTSMIPNMDQVRLTNSGTEATMTALRLIRGTTGRKKVIKFEGCYHGHADAFLVAAGSGLLTNGVSSSEGVPEEVVQDVYVLPYNDLKAVQDLCDDIGPELAGIFVEPAAGNMGLIPPVAGYLQGLRDVCDKHGSLLVFDEVITGFRFCPGTFGMYAGVSPDITCLGKIIGGGMPIGALGGKREVMENLAPLGNVYQAGTLSGNPVAVAAGTAMLTLLRDENPYPQIKELGDIYTKGITDILTEKGLNYNFQRLEGLFTLFFGEGPQHKLEDVNRCDTEIFAKWFRMMCDEGIYFSPSQYEVGFISAAHTKEDIVYTLEKAEKVLASL